MLYIIHHTREEFSIEKVQVGIILMSLGAWGVSNSAFYFLFRVFTVTNANYNLGRGFIISFDIYIMIGVYPVIPKSTRISFL